MTAGDLEPVARVSLLIRKPPSTVFRYFVEPELLTQFWLGKASAPLQLGSPARWDFLVPGASDDVVVTTLQDPSELGVRSADGSLITWRFAANADGETLVRIEQRDFPGSAEEAMTAALEAVSGFTLVLAELKLLLEQGRAMGLVRDKAQMISEHLLQTR